MRIEVKPKPGSGTRSKLTLATVDNYAHGRVKRTFEFELSAADLQHLIDAAEFRLREVKAARRIRERRSQNREQASKLYAQLGEADARLRAVGWRPLCTDWAYGYCRGNFNLTFFQPTMNSGQFDQVAKLSYGPMGAHVRHLRLLNMECRGTSCAEAFSALMNYAPPLLDVDLQNAAEYLDKLPYAQLDSDGKRKYPQLMDFVLQPVAKTRGAK